TGPPGGRPARARGAPPPGGGPGSGRPGRRGRRARHAGSPAAPPPPTALARGGRRCPSARAGPRARRQARRGAVALFLPVLLFLDEEAARRETLGHIVDHARMPAGIGRRRPCREPEALDVLLDHGVDTALGAGPATVAFLVRAAHRRDVGQELGMPRARGLQLLPVGELVLAARPL